MIPAPLLPYVVGGSLIAIAAGGWWLHHSGYQSGVETERASWQAARAELLELREAVKAKAETADTARRAVTERRLSPVREKVTRYVKTAAVCPDDAGRKLLNDAIAAAGASDTAASSGGVQGDPDAR